MQDTFKNKRDLLKWWENYCNELQRASAPEQLNESPSEKQKRIEKLLGDYNSFVNYYFTGVHRGTPSAKFHLKAAKKIKDESKLRAVFEWARGHAKSSHISLIIVIWLKMLGEIKTVVLVSKSEDDATRLLGKVQANLERNRRLIADFGQQVSLGSWAEGEFTSTDGVKFVAMGRGQSPRGLSSEDSFRPDLIIIDDIDDDELVENPKRVRRVVEWIKSALFGAMDMGRGRFIMVGNRIHKNSILANIATIPNIYHSQINALDKNGKPAWSEKYTVQEIQEACMFMGYRESQKEYFNNPIAEGTVFKAEWIQYTKLPSLKQMDSIIAYCDPSFKNTTTADYKAVAVVGKHKTRLYVIDCFVRQCSVSSLVQYLYQLHYKLPSTARYYIESNFMQDILLDEFYTEGLRQGFQLPIVGDTRKKPDKFARIEAISPLFERGLIAWNKKHEKENDFITAVEQLLSIEKGSRTADDFPDALEGAIWFLQREQRQRETGMKLGYRGEVYDDY